MTTKPNLALQSISILQDQVEPMMAQVNGNERVRSMSAYYRRLLTPREPSSLALGRLSASPGPYCHRSAQACQGRIRRATSYLLTSY